MDIDWDDIDYEDEVYSFFSLYDLIGESNLVYIDGKTWKDRFDNTEFPFKSDFKIEEHYYRIIENENRILRLEIVDKKNNIVNKIKKEDYKFRIKKTYKNIIKWVKR